ncbi:riboflavin synthase [Cesiribacter andamanensis]|uniref:Riboflavin synthase n=1 Tax=Cesiribacter andamanensis AMV16 TaxID=1279009 RepID=M7NSE2_9BACT|nr:riboflavin synthase [Cesiribacter andamanensis]EMR01394.1 Riboflavin synthase alpha chain [Cesiribacter andamanensis AMV16]
MFTGIIEDRGRVVAIRPQGTNITFELESRLAPELRIDQSVAHNGVCLTVVALSGDRYQVTAIEETLKKTNLGQLQTGSWVNLERCMPANGRFDGHFVQGHVDETATCTGIQQQEGSWLFDFEYSAQSPNITIEKGSITINGVSLTCFNSDENRFRVAIIPYTFAHTTFEHLQLGDTVNLEFDVIGKYLQKIIHNQKIFRT